MATIDLTWVAHRVNTEELDRARSFAEALQLDVLLDENDTLMLTTPRGDLIEYCGPGAKVPPGLFRQQTTAVGYKVDDLEETVERLTSAGFDTAGPTGNAPGVRFQHFRGPAGEVFAVICPVVERSSGPPNCQRTR